MWFLKIYLKKIAYVWPIEGKLEFKANNFDDILETKKAFLDYKSKDLEKPKN